MSKPLNLFAAALVSLTVATVSTTNAQTTPPADVDALLKKHICLTCHKVDQKLVGPAYTEVAKKKYTPEQMVELIYKPKPTNWPGYPPMAPMTQVPKEDALKIATWIASLAPKKKK
jgi:cytochrome c